MNKKIMMMATSLVLTTVAVITQEPVYATETISTQQIGWQGKNYIKPDGTKAKSEWIYDNGSWFYMKDNNEYAQNEWMGNYYLKQWGHMAQNEWLYDNGKWYYAKVDGKYAWQEWVGNYYLNYWGDMAKNQWIDYNGKWYYAKADGKYAWQEWMGNYYFNYWGDMAQSQWIDYNGKWYYAKDDGKYAWQEWIGNYYFNYWGDMAHDTWVDSYYVGSDGKSCETSTYNVAVDDVSNEDDLDERILTLIFDMIKSGKTQLEITLEVDKIGNGRVNLNEQVNKAKEIQFNNQINVERVNQKFVALLNQERQKLGVQPVRYQSQLLPAATIRTNELVTHYSHTRPNGTAPFTAIEEPLYSSYRWKGENIAVGSLSLMVTGDNLDDSVAKFFFLMWKNSPKHYELMTHTNTSDVALSVVESKGMVSSSLIMGGMKQ